MDINKEAHQIQQRTELNGADAVPYPPDPKVRQKLQSAIHRINKRYGGGMGIRTKRQFVDGEDLLVVWRIR